MKKTLNVSFKNFLHMMSYLIGLLCAPNWSD